MANNFFSTLPLEAIERIAEDKDFSGFLNATELSQALETDPSVNLSVSAENQSLGNNDHLINDQIELNEPQANSTLLEPVDAPAIPAPVLAEDADAEAGTEGPKSSEPLESGKRRRQRLARQRRKLSASLSRLSTGDGPQDSEAGPSNTQTPGIGAPNSKREKTSPGETSKPKRPRREESHPVQPSFAEAARSAIFLNIVPLDSEGKEIGATAGDRKFIVEKLELYIARSNPNINILEFSLKGKSLRLKCLNQKTLESVKSVVSQLKGPRGNLQGYQCLGPGDRPPLETYSIWVDNPVPQKARLLAILYDAHNWLNPKKMVVRAVIPKNKGSTFIIGVQPEIRTELERRNFQLHYGAGRTAHFKAKSKGHKTRAGEAS